MGGPDDECFICHVSTQTSDGSCDNGEMLSVATLFKRKRTKSVDGLVHVLVCGGSSVQWLDTTTQEWSRITAELSNSARGVGMRWITVCPYGGSFSEADRNQICERIARATGGAIERSTVTHLDVDGFTISFNVCADGQQRFVDVTDSLANSLITEDALSSAIHAPALFDPDLIVVHGPTNKVPQSLMWELGYSELVFVDTAWRKLKSTDVQQAISDFTTRERRFGGIDV